MGSAAVPPQLKVVGFGVSAAGANATCPVVLKNSGNMRIDAVALLGDSNNCSKALMAPDESLYCAMTRALVQSEYEQGSFTLRATSISGIARGPTPMPADPADVSDAVSLTLDQVPQLNVSLAVNRTRVYKAGDSVLYTITAVSVCCSEGLEVWFGGGHNHLLLGAHVHVHAWHCMWSAPV